MASTFAEELVDYLVTATVCSTKGTASGDIFYDYLPETSGATAVCIRSTGGGPPRKHSPQGMVTIQCLVRSATSYTAAIQKAAAVYEELHQMVNTDLENNHIIAGLALQHPTSIGTDERNRHLVSFNVVFQTYGRGAGDGGGKDPNDPTIQT